MRNAKEISTSLDRQSSPSVLHDASAADALIAKLDRDGIVILPSLVSSEQLTSMQSAFESRLRTMRWNNFDGYQQTESNRQMIEDVLLLEQGFVDVSLHPLV